MDIQFITGISSVIISVVTVGAGIGKVLMSIRNNDLKHIDARLDKIDVSLEKLDNRMEHHIMYHIHDKAAKESSSESP